MGADGKEKYEGNHQIYGDMRSLLGGSVGGIKPGARALPMPVSRFLLRLAPQKRRRSSI